MVFIPKPGKKLQLEALRPISLTSCLGKVLEHVVLNRLNRYAEANEVFADTMVGFRPKLSTQDVMLRLYHQIMAREYAPKRDTRAILGLDISKAFDNVSHAAILRGLNSIDVGERIFKYIQNFLSSRQVQVSIGGFQSDLQTLGGVGTPQGAVLSPFLFNIAMKDLPTKLQDIPNLHHSIYADDVTLWMVGGSDGAIQDSLQEAIRIVEAYAKERGLACSQEKSELLLMAGTTVKTPSGIILQVGGKDVPRVRRLRILGLWLQEDGKNTYSIGVLRNHAQQVGRLIARIAGKRYGMKERNVIRLIKAFVISRIAYIAPFLDLTLTERDAIDRIIRCEVIMPLLMVASLMSIRSGLKPSSKPAHRGPLGHVLLVTPSHLSQITTELMAAPATAQVGAFMRQVVEFLNSNTYSSGFNFSLYNNSSDMEQVRPSNALLSLP
ncbi:uncharacterized protein ISCGN_009684 [Ixodes scapularis]